ncbi:MAG: serine protease [Lachnospiraceae bacterium]|nr:serine protease [Lachnospiraceae bacterium]
MKENLKKIVLSLCLSAGLAAVVFLGFWLWTLIPPKSYSAEEIYEMAAPSVVEINVTSYKGDSTGTGFFYDDNGTVITSYRVIKGSSAVSIKTQSGEEYEVVSVRGFDEARDIAVLDTRCRVSKPLPFRADDLKIKAGEPAYVIGGSFGVTDGLSEGVISGIAKEVGGQTYMEITAEVSLKDTGAPLMDKYGNVVGISTYTFVDGEKMNLALPIGQLEYVPKNSPTLLSELFKPE